MAEPQMTPENGAVVLALYAIARIVETFMKQLIGLFKRKNADDAKAREDAKTENAEREQWLAINKMREDLADHEKEDASAFATLNATQSSILRSLERMEPKVDALHRRSTGQVKRND
jgi:hypothetical protein